MKRSFAVLVCISLSATFSAFADSGEERIKALSEQVFESTSGGNFRSSRRHATGEKAKTVKETLPTLNNEVILVRHNLSRELMIHRLGGETPSNLYSRINDFNSLFRKLDSSNIVYDEDNTFGSFGGSTPALNAGVKSLGEIELTRFDFTTGFQAECKDAYKAGVIVFRNTKTGEIHWSQSYKSGLAVVGEAADGSAITKESYQTGLTSDFNPTTERWEYFEGNYLHANAAVYNPATQQVEVQESGYKSGIGGVFNPLTRLVEWKSSYRNGVAGYFDPTQGKVIWVESYKSGVACIWRDSNGQYHTSSSFFGGISGKYD